VKVAKKEWGGVSQPLEFEAEGEKNGESLSFTSGKKTKIPNEGEKEITDIPLTSW